MTTQKKETSVKVFDFFAGCGGTSRGLADAGMEVFLALDNDPDAEQSAQRFSASEVVRLVGIPTL